MALEAQVVRAEPDPVNVGDLTQPLDTHAACEVGHGQEGRVRARVPRGVPDEYLARVLAYTRLRTIGP